jgi:excisionase family DNA binding protein
MDDKLLTVAQAAERIGITTGALRDAIARERLAVIRVGGGGKRAGFTLIHEDEVNRYVAEIKGKRGPKQVSGPHSPGG